MKSEKMISRKMRKINSARRLLSTFLMIAMLLAASMSAVAFAASLDEEVSAVAAEEAYVSVVAEELIEATTEEIVPAIEESTAEAPTAEESIAEESPANPEVPSDSSTSSEPATFVEVEVAEEAEEIGIEALSGVLPGDVVAIYVDGTTANDIGFTSLSAAISAAPVGATIYFLGNVTEATTIIVNSDLTLDFRGHNLTTSGISILGANTEFTILGGGTLNASLNGVFTTAANPTIVINANIDAGSIGISTGLGSGGTVVVNGNVVGETVAISAGSGTTSITVNGDVRGTTGVLASGGGAIRVNGSVTGTTASAINASGSATVIVGGNVSTAANLAAAITTLGTSSVTVNGNVASSGDLGGINASGDSRVNITGDITVTSTSLLAAGVSSSGNAQVRVTGDITAPVFVRVAMQTFTRAERDATSSLPGYDQFTNAGSTVWVLSGGTSGSQVTSSVPSTPPTTGSSGTSEAAAETTTVARTSTAGPKTGDADNWFIQIAAIAALTATIAAAVLYRTREQN
ncbi:MAG: hypothetical protein FWE48_00020 [Coriobacteriia bacterium]|nr:hypothetical protein [Coriobacteriia bacterium]MCL2871213.1 hypothetical protein [Coriobacteriia bacterium]